CSDFPGLTVIVESYECDTLEDVGRLYGHYDSAMASRTTSDINRSFAATLPELKDISRRVLDSCASGITLPKIGAIIGSMNSKPPTERAEYLLEYPEFVTWVNALCPDASNNHKPLVRQGVVAAMFGTWQKSHSAAAEFWTQVR